MAYKNDERICSYILINHYYMTVAEMAHELKISDPTVKNICTLLKVVPITLGERAKEFILKNKHLTKEQLAAKLGLTAESISFHAKEMGIELSTNFQKELEARQKKTEKLTRKRNPKKPEYNQSGSDLLDKFRGITTTTRVQVKASDAFFK